MQAQDNTYTAKDIKQLRAAVDLLCLNDDNQLSSFERRSLTEQILRNYMLAGVSAANLHVVYAEEVMQRSRDANLFEPPQVQLLVRLPAS